MHAPAAALASGRPAVRSLPTAQDGGDRSIAALVEQLFAQARAKGQPWALARAARCRGLLAPDGELDEVFGEALANHRRTEDAFETARTQLACGARLQAAVRATGERARRT